MIALVGAHIVSFNLTDGTINGGNWKEENYIRPVLTLKDNVEFSGAGTESSPYIVSNY